MNKVKAFFTNKRILFLIFLLIISLYLLPSYKKGGAEVSFVFKDSPFYGKVVEGDLIKSVNGVPAKTIDDYTAQILKIKPGDTLKLETNRLTFSSQVNSTQFSNETAYIGLNVKRVSNTRVRLGLELQGGARVTILPKTTTGAKISDQLLSTTSSVLAKRLDAYGLSGVIPKTIEDFQGKKYIVVEMAGEGSERLVDLVKSVGKFELKVLNTTIFGGESIIPPIGEPGKSAQTGAWQVGLNINSNTADHFRDNYLNLTPSQPATCSEDTECSAGFACSSHDIG